MNRLVQHDQATAARITKHRRLIDFRNLIIHGYDLVDHGLVWSTIEDEVRVLLAEVVALLRSVP
jgi:uncharacterized protein with HEPN domain